MRGELAFAVELNEACASRQADQHPGQGVLQPAPPRPDPKVGEVIADREFEYRDRWRTELATRTVTRLQILELACGSANDYRAFDDYGLAPFLDYAGVDLNPKNIANARRRFSGRPVHVGSALDLDEGDGSVDWCSRRICWSTCRWKAWIGSSPRCRGWPGRR